MPTNYTKHQLRLFYFHNKYDQRVQIARNVNVPAGTSTATENDTTEVTATVTATSPPSEASVSTTTQSTAYAEETVSSSNNVEPEVAISLQHVAAEPERTTSSTFIMSDINIDATMTSSTDTTCAVESNLPPEDGNLLSVQPTGNTSMSMTSE